MDENKPGRLDAFTQFLKKASRRVGHLTWGPGDVEHLPDRRDHLAWKRGDVETPPKTIRDSLKEGLDGAFIHSHLLGIQKAPSPLPLITHIPHEEMMHQAQHREAYTGDHHHSHDHYKAWSYGVNGPLRDNGKGWDGDRHTASDVMRKELDFHTKHLDHITSLHTKHDMTFYRGFGHAFPTHEMEPGKEFVDHGYTGMSRKPQVAIGASYPLLAKHGWSGQGHVGAAASMSPEHYVDDDHPLAHHYSIAQIHVPAGAKGHLLDHPHFTNTPLRHEEEFLLHRGTKFRILGHSSNDHGVAHIPTHQLSVFPQHPNPKIHVVHMEAVDQP